MLLVPVDLRPSPLHGLGAFARNAIPAGAPVWRFTPGFDLDLDPGELGRLPDRWRSVLQHYGYVDSRRGRFVLCCDDARFINHSSQPNLVADLALDPRHGVDIAARDIAAGDELTVDYGSLEGFRPAENVVCP